MIIQTTRFGEVEYEQNEEITFVNGVLGFEQMNQFVFMDHPGSPFQFLQSTLDPDLAFVVTDPFSFFQKYEFDLTDTVKNKLNLHSDMDVQIKVIITVRSETDITANLKAPIVINQSENKAVQLILDNPDYQIRHSIIMGGPSDADLIEE
ncbi:flagellar assembly protein FliW [Paenibacillus aceris]|uniref:Flagellar assembly factor FliW n=1 Tax=Paenibacillus aceris TaxID=869555 RepID=A0ABS4I5J4_9BACL|nr:flagellar assembly protein FliW [Paenibacillus aceris]MBP1965801.1 flagellar assembly factor FliW [Paenibacillus aceris]NHW34853.1 flagellar assembly protein FliW [Paenibacillus aceris]